MGALIQQLPEQRAEEVIGLSHVLSVELVTKVGIRATVPDRIQIGSLGDGRLQVQTPIVVRFSIEGDQFIAEAGAFNEFGFGANPSEALRDLQRALTELYFLLEGEQHRLGPDLALVWAKLQQTIRRRL